MKLPLRGIIPPIVTPLLDNNTLDEEGLEKLIEHLISVVYMDYSYLEQQVRPQV